MRLLQIANEGDPTILERSRDCSTTANAMTERDQKPPGYNTCLAVTRALLEFPLASQSPITPTAAVAVMRSN